MSRAEWGKKDAILDFIYEFIKTNGQPVHYSILMEEVEKKFLASRATDLVQAKARFYTWLNLDVRFVYLGEGRWGLRSWAPQKGTRRVPLVSLMHKTVEYNDEPPRASEEEELGNELFPAQELLRGKVKPVSGRGEFEGENY